MRMSVSAVVPETTKTCGWRWKSCTSNWNLRGRTARNFCRFQLETGSRPSAVGDPEYSSGTKVPTEHSFRRHSPSRTTAKMTQRGGGFGFAFQVNDKEVVFFIFLFCRRTTIGRYQQFGLQDAPPVFGFVSLFLSTFATG